MNTISVQHLLTRSLTHSFSICSFESLFCASDRDMCAQGAVGEHGGNYPAWCAQERLPGVAIS